MNIFHYEVVRIVKSAKRNFANHKIVIWGYNNNKQKKYCAIKNAISKQLIATDIKWRGVLLRGITEEIQALKWIVANNKLEQKYK